MSERKPIRVWGGPVIFVAVFAVFDMFFFCYDAFVLHNYGAWIMGPLVIVMCWSLQSIVRNRKKQREAEIQTANILRRMKSFGNN